MGAADDRALTTRLSRSDEGGGEQERHVARLRWCKSGCYGHAWPCRGRFEQRPARGEGVSRAADRGDESGQGERRVRGVQEEARPACPCPRGFSMLFSAGRTRLPPDSRRWRFRPLSTRRVRGSGCPRAPGVATEPASGRSQLSLPQATVTHLGMIAGPSWDECSRSPAAAQGRGRRGGVGG